MNLRTVIIDDETAARETLASYLGKYCEGIDLVGEAQDVPSAVRLIRSVRPDLVFLDVEMPFGNAFDVLEQTTDLEFDTIFVTAFSDYAIKAFNFSAAYYILKPVDIRELTKAVQKVREGAERHARPLTAGVLSENMKNPARQKLVLPTQGGFEVVGVQDIIRLSGSSNYTEIFLKDGKKKVVSRVLKTFEDLLCDQGFMRIHKSHIVNLEQIRSYHKGKGGSVILSDGCEIEVSPLKKAELLNYFT